MNGAFVAVANRTSPVVTRFIGRTGLKLRKNAPNILFTAGIVGSVASTVLACKATLKLPDTMDEIEKDLSLVKDRNTWGVDNGQEITITYIRSGLKLGRLYGPAIGIGVASIACLGGAHHNLTRRNTALMAAYTTLQTAYDSYRDRVRAELGDDRELDLYRGTLEMTGDKDGITSGEGPNGHSAYARLFDEYSDRWVRDSEMNMIFIKCQQSYLNDMLQARGHVFLNEAYDRLGLDRTTEGQVVGWIRNGNGDNYIDFGIFDEGNERFVNGWENSVLLDFNVDGVIYKNI